MTTHPFRDTAFRLLAAGYNPVPIVPNTKRPILAGWQRFCREPMPCNTVERFARSAALYGVGITLGWRGLVGIDIDTDDAEIVGVVSEVAATSRVIKRGKRGYTSFFHDPTATVRTQHLGGLVDVLALGTQTVIPPTLHPTTGQSYVWLSEMHLFNVAPEDLPAISPDIADLLREALSPWLSVSRNPAPVCKPRISTTTLSVSHHTRQRRYVDRILLRDLQKLASMVPNSGRNIALFRLVCRVGRWVHHDILSEAEFVILLLDACVANGLVREDSRRSVQETIASGLRRSAEDCLPVLTLGARSNPNGEGGQ